MKYFILLASILILTGCLGLGVGVPENIKPVSEFELEKYLGTWYEIARLDHPFERGLEYVTAEYSIRKEGGINVLNRGYSPDKDKWSEASGKAFFVQNSNTGYLKVSFFGPFYSSYIIFELDKDYQYAFVCGSNMSFLWLLSRTPTIDADVKNNFLEKAAKLGFNTDNLQFIDQSYYMNNN